MFQTYCILTQTSCQHPCNGGGGPWRLLVPSFLHSPCDEDCKVIVCGLARSHIQWTLKLAEVVENWSRLSCSNNFCLRQNSKKPTNSKQVEKSYNWTIMIETLISIQYVLLYVCTVCRYYYWKSSLITRCGDTVHVCIITGTLLPWTRHLHWHSAEEPGGSHSTVLIGN